jgi:hypothetical protein
MPSDSVVEGRMNRGIVIGLMAALAVGGCAIGASPSPSLSADQQRMLDQVAIDQIEVKWHEASSTKNIDLMMSLWADNATFTAGGQTYTGKADIRNFFATKAAPFQAKNKWVSDTPAYKIRTTVDGDKGTLYFECDYIDVVSKQVANFVSADNAVARVNGNWVITNSVAAAANLAP